MAWRWTALPWRSLPCHFDLLAVCLSLRRERSRSPLLQRSAPARGCEGTCGAQRESGGAPHIQSTQTDTVAPQETIPEDPETGPKPGTHLSKVSTHIGTVPQPQMFKSAAVGRTDFQSSEEERKARGRDWRAMEELPNSAASPEETSLYVSKMDLGPLAPAGSSGAHLPPTFQKEVQVEAEERGPQVATFLPSCPPSSGIPGVADLHQSLLRAWPEDTRALVHKLCGRGLPPLLHPGPFASGDHGGMTRMVLSGLSRAGPGSPRSSETALLVSTCPQVSRIPGLPSVGRASRCVWDGCSLWRKASWPEEPFGSLMKNHTVAPADVDPVMAAMLPTCPRGARTPGFPSAGPPKALSGPSMAGLLPTCPTHTAVVGMPFRAKVGLSFHRWPILGEGLILKPPSRNSVPVDESLAPCCLWKVGGSLQDAHLVSRPPAAHQCPSVVDFVPACPSRSRVLGLPSKEFISSQRKSFSDKSLMGEGWNGGADSVGGILDSEQGELSAMVAMLPSCPARTCLLGLPSRPHKPLSHLETQRPDAEAQRVSKVRDYPALSPGVVQPLTWKDWGDMVDMSPSCPKEATVFGLPSAPRQEARMLDLLPSCPGHTQICGLPSKAAHTPGACQGWPQGGPAVPRGVRLLRPGWSSDESGMQAMAATRPSCPVVACVPGLPSALTLTDGPKMLNSSHGFTAESRVPGMSLGPHTNQIKWTMAKHGLLLPQKEPTDLGTVMVSRLQSCPDHGPCLLGVHRVGMAEIQAGCPQTGGVLGVASKHVHRSGQGWPGRDTLGGTAGTEMVGPVQSPVPEGSVGVRQANASSALETSVQVGQTSPGLRSTEISQKEAEPDRKKRRSQTGAGFGASREKEDAAAMGRG